MIYFGPMGCQTGFYFLFDSRRLTDEAAIRLVQQVFAAGAAYDGPMPGKSAAECGNFRNLDAGKPGLSPGVKTSGKRQKAIDKGEFLCYTL